MAGETRLRGPDVSSWQHGPDGKIDWVAVKEAGNTFAFIKATEGTDYLNKHFNDDTNEMRRIGLLRGAYHYPRFDESPELQAAWYVFNAFPQNVAGSLPPILDVEENQGMPPEVMINWMSRWLPEVRALTGRKPIVYASPNLWKELVANYNGFTEYPLWVADWNGRAQPQLFGGWTNWLFWQKTNKAVIPGIAKPADMNVFNGTLDQLTALANIPYFGSISTGSN